MQVPSVSLHMQTNTFSNGTLAGTHCCTYMYNYIHECKQITCTLTLREKGLTTLDYIRSVLFRTYTRYYYCVSTTDVRTDIYNMSGVIMGVKKNRLSGNHNSHHTTVIREAVIEVE